MTVASTGSTRLAMAVLLAASLIIGLVPGSEMQAADEPTDLLALDPKIPNNDSPLPHHRNYSRRASDVLS